MLRERLEAIGVEVSVETFEESQGIAGLGDDPFVSCTVLHVVRTCNAGNTFKYLEHMSDHRSNFQTETLHRFSLIPRPSLPPIYLPVCKYGEGCLCLPDIDEISSVLAYWKRSNIPSFHMC